VPALGRRACGRFGAALLLASTHALAVDAPPETVRPGFVEPPPAGAFRLPPVPLAPVPSRAPEARVEIRDVAFVGNTAIDTSELRAVARRFVGRRAGAAEVEELRQLLTRLYVERGYVNSGAVLDSVRPDGVVIYRIVEGRLAAIRLRGLDGLDERYVAGRLARADDGAFNAEVLRERFQLLLGDPLFTRMNARIVPGAAVGEAILDVDIERAPARGLVAYLNNHRPPSIGSTGMGLRGWWRNLTGLGDVVEGSVEDSSRWDSGIRLALSGRLPLNASGTSAVARYDRGRTSVVEEPLQILGIRSTLESAEIGLAQVFEETLRRKLSAGVSFLGRENRTWLLGIPFSFVAGEPDGRTRTRSVRFWQEYALRSEADALVARSTFSFVRTNLEESPQVTSPFQPDRRYHLWLGQAQYARRIGESGVQAIVRATVQRTNDRLLALDALPIGGVASVRGYRENQLIRDSARIFNLEVEWPAWRDGERGVAATLVPFADYGRGRGRHQPATTLASVGMAARLTWGRLAASLALALKLTRPAAVDASHGNLQDRGVHFELAWRLD
jgi:hemolysin activation/secretion protein